MARLPARDVFGQPLGLITLAGTELWDRISFHGMQALLVLYMVGQLLLPGHVERIVGFATFRGGIEAVTGPLTTTALAAQIFGLYVGLVYFTPIVGGAIGDRVGRRPTITAGALLMTAGHFAMAFDQSFLLAMLCLILGAGAVRGNLEAQVGALYGQDDRRRDDGFQLYYIGINVGAFVAPIVCGFLGAAYGWHFAFGFAGVGMLIGLAVYLAGGRHLPPDPVRAATPRDPLTPAEWRVVAVLVALIPVLALFWIAQTQMWNVYNLWVQAHVDLRVFGWTMPVPWLQAIDGVAPVVLMGPTLALWRWQAARGTEPDDVAKLAIGCLIFAAATAWLAAAPLAASGGRVPLLWAIAFHLISNEGWLFFVPIVLALYTRAAPPAISATMIGVMTLAVFVGSTVSGRLGGLYETLDPSRFWLLHAGVVGAGGVIFLVAGPWLRRELAPHGLRREPVPRPRRALAPRGVVAAAGHPDLERDEVGG